jgi:prepilin-type processing-associated H-X9-DG protein
MNVTVRCLTMRGETLGVQMADVLFADGHGYPTRPVVIRVVREGHVDHFESEMLGVTVPLPIKNFIPPYVYSGDTITLEPDGPMLTLHPMVKGA